MGKETKEKRVRITLENYVILEEIAKNMKVPLSECLDRITNKAIQDSHRPNNQGMYVWKS